MKNEVAIVAGVVGASVVPDPVWQAVAAALAAVAAWAVSEVLRWLKKVLSGGVR